MPDISLRDGASVVIGPIPCPAPARGVLVTVARATSIDPALFHDPESELGIRLEHSYDNGQTWCDGGEDVASGGIAIVKDEERATTTIRSGLYAVCAQCGELFIEGDTRYEAREGVDLLHRGSLLHSTVRVKPGKTLGADQRLEHYARAVHPEEDDVLDRVFHTPTKRLDVIPLARATLRAIRGTIETFATLEPV